MQNVGADAFRSRVLTCDPLRLKGKGSRCQIRLDPSGFAEWYDIPFFPHNHYDYDINMTIYDHQWLSSMRPFKPHVQMFHDFPKLLAMEKRWTIPMGSSKNQLLVSVSANPFFSAQITGGVMSHQPNVEISGISGWFMAFFLGKLVTGNAGKPWLLTLFWPSWWWGCPGSIFQWMIWCPVIQNISIPGLPSA